MTGTIYLDHAATTPMRREVLEAMFPYFQRVYGNPSSVHSAGHEAADALREARERIAWVLECAPEEIVFTSGGTESDNLAIIGGAEARRAYGDHVIVSTVEHEAVLQSVKELRRRGFEVTLAPVDDVGRIDPEVLTDLVTERTILVSCIYANNEIGTIQPIAEIAAAVRRANPKTLIHTDAVQAAGSLPLSVERLGIDMMSHSAHKIYGPRGVGVLYVRRGFELQPLLYGGGQERGVRSGTENVAGAVGMATALDLAESERAIECTRLIQLRDRLIAGMLDSCPSAHLTGDPLERLPGHASFYFDDRSGESVLVDLDAHGILCSSGSACHAGQTDPSHVLLALGLAPSEARNGLRMTLGRENDDTHVKSVLKTVSELFGAVQVTPARV